MAGELYVSPEELKSISDRVREQVSRYKTCYDRIYGEVDNLSTTWKGDANLAFTTQIRGFQADFESMHKLLDKYAEFLTVASHNYQRTENINIDNASKMLTF